jgi:hypothetical protein
MPRQNPRASIRVMALRSSSTKVRLSTSGGNISGIGVACTIGVAQSHASRLDLSLGVSMAMVEVESHICRTSCAFR